MDILVFPEATLNYYSIPGNATDDDRIIALEYATFVPDPTSRLVPCDVVDENNNYWNHNESQIMYR